MESTNFGRFVWYDLMSPDPEASTAFYTATLGWGTRVDRPLLGVEGQPPYTMLTAAGQPLAGIVPFNDAYWLGYVSVSDVERSVTQAAALGGELRFGPRDIANVGRFAVLGDPQGAEIAIFQSAATPSSSPPAAPKPLEFSWHELVTADPVAALAFYRAMFEWDALPFGRMVYRSGEAPAAWRYSVAVSDVRDTANRVRQNGGQVTEGPRECRAGDWTAECRDPLGAAFALRQTGR